MQYSTAFTHESGAVRAKFAPQPNPAATIRGVVPFVEGILGSAPAATSIRIAGISVACAARQNAVAPDGSTQLWSPESDRNQTFCVSLAFGFAPLSSRAFIRSMYLM